MRSVIVFAVLALAAAAVTPRYADRVGSSPKSAPLASQAAAPVVAAVADSQAGDSRSVVVSPDSRGHFIVDARVDARRLTFMIDTGASVIALTARDAAALGIHPARREFVAEVRTANGTVHAAPAMLDRVEVGDLVVHNVAALVLPDEALSENLLGLSFLSRLHRFEYSGGKLVLEQ
jgi:aspartyl protease family protein